MTNREIFKRILQWEVPERIAWVPRLDIWYNANKYMGTLPKCIENMSLGEVEKYLGMGHASRDAIVFRKVFKGGVVEEYIDEPDSIIHRYTTPKGTVEGIWRYLSEDRKKGLGKTVLKHYIVEEKDYEIMQYVIENMDFVPAYDSYLEYSKRDGDEALPLVNLGQCPMHQIMLIYVGYTNFYYHLADFPDKINALLETMEQKYRQMWDIAANSPALFFLHGAHFSSDMTPPQYSRNIFCPIFRNLTTKCTNMVKRLLSTPIQTLQDCWN